MNRFTPPNLTLTALSCALAVVAAPACHDDLVAPPDVLGGDDIVARVLAPDPAHVTVYEPCPASGTFAGVPVQLRFPSATGCLTAVDDSPMVVLLHGNGYEYDTYEYLLDHLAANGFVAASLGVLAQPDDPLEHEDAAGDARAALDSILISWPMAAAIDPTRLAIVGHSRGGRTMRYLADELKGNADAWTVRALVGLASQAGEQLPVDGDETVGLLLLQGTSDGDQPPARAYYLYDGAGTEGTAGPFHPNALYKAMKLLGGGNHGDFSEEQSPGNNQAVTTRGYVLAFLAAHLLYDDTWYEDYIRSDNVPGPWGEVVTQVSDGFLRTVIDEFEDGALADPTIGGTLTASLGMTASVIDLEADPDSPHYTHALKLAGASSGAGVSWSFPVVDVSEYKWLSMRIGQITGEPSGALFVRLHTASGWSDPVELGDHGTIPSPRMMCTTGGNLCNQEVLDHMGTVRVPLSAFDVPLDGVDGVQISFTIKSAGKRFILDSLEFAEWIYKP